MPVLHNITITMEISMNLVDIHTHILFDIDDGAVNLEESMAMVRTWIDQGVSTVVATPHFDIKKDDKQRFLEKRTKSATILRTKINEEGLSFTIKTSAELYFRRELIYEDLTPFLIEGTNYLVIELPTRTIPAQIKSTFEELIMQGYNPILVHIERYPVLKQDLDLFHDLVRMGVVCQVNAEHFIEGTDSFVQAAVKKNFVHLTGSDAHNMDRRAPNLKDGLISSGQNTLFNKNALSVVNDLLIDTEPKGKLKKIFKRYY